MTPCPTVQSHTSRCTGERMPIWIMRVRVDQPLLDGVEEDRAVREGLAEIVGPRVDMRVEMDQRDAARAPCSARSSGSVMPCSPPRADQMRRSRPPVARSARGCAGCRRARSRNRRYRRGRALRDRSRWRDARRRPASGSRAGSRAGPSRAPARLVVPISNGTPATVNEASRSVRAMPMKPAGVANVGEPATKILLSGNREGRSGARVAAQAARRSAIETAGSESSP